MNFAVAFVIVVTLFEIPRTLGIKPEFLWGVINETLLERRIPKYCTKLIFHNNSTLADVEVSKAFIGEGNSFIDLHATFSGGTIGAEYFPREWDAAEASLDTGLKALIEDKVDPCLVVASFVFNSVQYDVHLGNSTNRRALRHRLADLFQFSTPIRNRHLFLLRLAEEFNLCPKGPKYPTRLVPQWELILFDFFHEARVIQGPFHDEDKPYLHVTRETGKWRWLCDDIIERLELEKNCQSNQTCLIENGVADLWNPLGPLPSSQPCVRGFRPRQ